MFKNKFKVSKKDLKKIYFATKWYPDCEIKFKPYTINFYHKICVRVIDKFELMLEDK